MQIVDLLNKSEFLECKETDSILDYLVKQRVLTDIQYQEIVSTNPIKLKNTLLLETLQLNLIEQENENINIYGLFVNALRYAGCHHIANILDVDEPLQINNDNNNTRKKGQISIFIQVSAVQIKAKHLIPRQTSQNETNNTLNRNNNSIWLEKRLFDGDKTALGNVSQKSKKSNLFSCLFCCVRKQKYISQKPTYNFQSAEIISCDNQEVDKGRQLKIDILTEKSIQFYTHLSNSSSAEREALIKYLEQCHQILVFDTSFDDNAMVVTVICTKQETLSGLRNSLHSGQLERDFSSLLLSRALLELLEVKDLRLCLNVPPEEIVCAMRELDSTKKKRS